MISIIVTIILSVTSTSTIASTSRRAAALEPAPGSREAGEAALGHGQPAQAGALRCEGRACALAPRLVGLQTRQRARAAEQLPGPEEQPAAEGGAGPPQRQPAAAAERRRLLLPLRAEAGDRLPTLAGAPHAGLRERAQRRAREEARLRSERRPAWQHPPRQGSGGATCLTPLV